MSRKVWWGLPALAFVGMPWVYRFFEKAWLAVNFGVESAAAMATLQMVLTFAASAILAAVATEEPQ